MRKHFLVFGLLLSIVSVASAQKIDKIINEKEIARIEKTLSADDMQGRRTFTPGIDKAALFIADEFKKAGIQPVKGSYLQEFTVPQTQNNFSGNIDGKPIVSERVAMLTLKESWTLTNDSAFEKLYIRAGDTLQSALRSLQGTGKNYLVLVDASHSASFTNIRGARRVNPNMISSFLLLLNTPDLSKFSVSLARKTEQAPLKNVVGMIPGKSKKDEIVIFSGHYDHLGIGAADAKGDSIFNGANDDAAGTTAVIILAKYFADKKDNERTIVFAAFTGEEVGLFGSRYFSAQYDSSKVVAMFNIEMIGTESKWGKASAYITGYDKTDLGKILEKNLTGTAFKFYPDPYIKQDLFYRSDNATLARQGVAAHTISTSKMDAEPNYHKQSDEFETLDMKNMTEIIKAIAISSTSIVAGKDTPSRVDTKSLR